MPRYLDVAFHCNVASTGRYAARCAGVEIRSPGDGALIAEAGFYAGLSHAPSFIVETGRLHFLRRWYPYDGVQRHVGNWAWDRLGLAMADVIELLLALRADGRYLLGSCCPQALCAELGQWYATDPRPGDRVFLGHLLASHLDAHDPPPQPQPRPPVDRRPLPPASIAWRG